METAICFDHISMTWAGISHACFLYSLWQLLGAGGPSSRTASSLDGQLSATSSAGVLASLHVCLPLHKATQAPPQHGTCCSSQSKNSKQDGEAASVLRWTQHHFFHLLLVKQTQSLLRFKVRGPRSWLSMGSTKALAVVFILPGAQKA